MKRIIYTRADGGVSVVVPAYNDKISGFKPELETEDEYLQRVIDRSIPKDVIDSVRIVPTEIIPSDRTFRNAWTDVMPGPQIDVDMDKARVLQMDKIRELRDKKLVELDPEVMKALESGDSVALADLAAQKQVLRDIPQTFDLSVFTTPEALKNAIPVELL